MVEPDPTAWNFHTSRPPAPTRGWLPGVGSKYCEDTSLSTCTFGSVTRFHLYPVVTFESSVMLITWFGEVTLWLELPAPTKLRNYSLM